MALRVLGLPHVRQSLSAPACGVRVEGNVRTCYHFCAALRSLSESPQLPMDTTSRVSSSRSIPHRAR
jgi:hypothetical protein